MALSTPDTGLATAHAGKYYTPEPTATGSASATLAAEALTPIIAKLVASISQSLAVPVPSRSDTGVPRRYSASQSTIADKHGVCDNDGESDVDGDHSIAQSEGNHHAPVHSVCGNKGSGQSGENDSHGDEAIETLIQNFPLLAKNGLISVDTLKDVACGKLPGLSKEVQHAANYLLKHSDLMDSIETAQGRHDNNAVEATKDGLISMGDLTLEKENRQRATSTKPMTEAEAVQALKNNFILLRNPATQLISTSSLLLAAKGKFGAEASAAEKADSKRAAQYFIDHPKALTAVETSDGRRLGNSVWATPDDLVSIGDVNTQLHNLETKAVPATTTVKPKTAHKKEEPMTEESAIMALQDSYDLLAEHSSGYITTDALKRAAKDEFSGKASPLEKHQAQRAAQYFLDHPTQLKSLDTANGHRIGDAKTSKADGRISRSDLLSEANSLPLSKDDISILNTLLIHQPKNEPHWYLGRTQMAAILKDPAAPADLKDAIKKLQDDPALYRRLDTANQVTNGRSAGNFGDGIISDNSLNALVLRPEVAKSKQISKERLAFALLSANRLFMTGGEDRPLIKGDLQNASFGDGPFSILDALSKGVNISELVKVAKTACFFLENEDLFNKLNPTQKT